MTSDARTRRQQRRLVLLATLRVLATSTAVVVAYYLLPLDRLEAAPVAVPVVVGLLILAAVGAWDIRAIVEAKHPSIRAVEALSGYVPLFLVLFASVYFLMSRTNPTSFNVHPLTRTDTLYFTLTVFSTVGFGDINATSQTARVAVMIQIVLNLVLLGLGLRLLTQAVQIGVTRRHAEQPFPDTSTPSEEADAGGPPAGG